MAISFLSSIEITGSCTVTSIGNDNSSYTGILVWDGSALKYRTKAQLLSDIGAGSGTGTVTSVTVTGSNGLSGTGTITSSGTITLSNSDRGSAQNIFKNIAAAGQSNIVADNNNDTLIFKAGSNITIKTDASTDTIEIIAKDTTTNYYLSSASFNTGNGVLTLNRSGLSAVTVDLDGRYLELGGGTMTGDLILGDNDKIQLGNSQDLQIYHDGSHSRIKDAGAGNLTINATDFVVNNSADTKNMITAYDGGTVNLYYNASQKFRTVNAGVEVTGNIDLTPSSSDILMIDNNGAALEVKQGSDLYMRFITTNGGEHIEVNKNIELQGMSATSGTFSSTITANNGQIVLGGTGRIQGVDTVSSGTDAANKTYVDNAISNYRPTAPGAPNNVSTKVVGDTIEVIFGKSSTNNIDYYQVWSSDDGADFGIIGQVPPDDFAGTMTIVDTTFNTSGTMSYRVYAVKEGIYSSPTLVSQAYTAGALSVINMSVIQLASAYYVQYDLPLSRFIDHIEIYMDSQPTKAALSRSNAKLVYSGMNSSYMEDVGVSRNFHQFWVEVITT